MLFWTLRDTVCAQPISRTPSVDGRTRGEIGATVVRWIPVALVRTADACVGDDLEKREKVDAGVAKRDADRWSDVPHAIGQAVRATFVCDFKNQSVGVGDREGAMLGWHGT